MLTATVSKAGSYSSAVPQSSSLGATRQRRNELREELLRFLAQLQAAPTRRQDPPARGREKQECNHKGIRYGVLSGRGAPPMDAMARSIQPKASKRPGFSTRNQPSRWVWTSSCSDLWFFEPKCQAGCLYHRWFDGGGAITCFCSILVTDDKIDNTMSFLIVFQMVPLKPPKSGLRRLKAD